MYKWEHKYTDYNGNERTETFYFNFNKGELMELEWRTPGGLENYMKTIMSLMDGQKLADMFCMLIDKSYGVKGPDGREFIKSDEVLKHFQYTEAYSDLKIALATDDKFAAEFVNGIFPREAVEEARRQKEMAEKAGLNLVPPQSSSPLITNSVPAAVQAPVVSSVPMVEGQQVFSPEQPTF